MAKLEMRDMAYNYGKSIHAARECGI